jgi:peptidoglycan/LPS O-acetylase OafA/YrhL
MGRLQGIEGLRAVAAAAVLAHHVLFVLTPERAAVPLPEPLRVALLDLRGGLTLFFVLSGFLLFRPVAAALLEGRPLPEIRRYARSRALRILPAYWVALLGTSFVLQVAIIPEVGVGVLDDPRTLLASFALVQSWSPDTVFAGIGPAWSLCTELSFYVLLPVLGVLAARRLRPGPAAALAPGLLLVAVGVLAKGAWSVLEDDLDRWAAPVGQSLPVHADLFGAGMVAAVLLLHAPRPGLRPVAWALAAGAALLAVVLAGREGIQPASPEDALLGLASACVVLAVTLPGRTVALRLLEWRPVVGVGLASYSIYLWHVPLIFWLGERGLDARGPAGLALAGLVVVAATAVVATASYVLVERPAMRLRRGRGPASATAPAMAQATP